MSIRTARRGYRPAAAPLDRLLRGAGRLHLQVVGAGQEGKELPHRLRAGRLHDQQQQVLLLGQRLGLDGDAVTSRGRGRDA
jgi:hypothetical protein